MVFFLQDDDTKKIAQGNSVILDDIILSNGGSTAQDNNSYFYPNPVRNQLSLYSKDFSTIENISINDMLGRKLLQQNSYSTSINVVSLRAGVYLVSYLHNQKRKTEKIVKQ